MIFFTNPEAKKIIDNKLYALWAKKEPCLFCGEPGVIGGCDLAGRAEIRMDELDSLETYTLCAKCAETPDVQDAIQAALALRRGHIKLN